MARAAFTLSPFKLGMFRRCPRQYKYHYVDNLAKQYGKPRPYFTMGDHVHAALKMFFSQNNRDRTFTALEQMLRTRWNKNRRGFEAMEQERFYGLKALSQLRWFCETQDLHAQPHMLEDFHETALSPELALLGKVDRVDQYPDGSLHIIDYKTGKTPADPDDLQLLTYAVLISKKLGTRISQVSYLYLNGHGWRTLEPTDDQLDKTVDLLFSAKNEIAAEQEFPSRPSQLCHFCDFKELCEPRLDADEWEDDLDSEPPF